MPDALLHTVLFAGETSSLAEIFKNFGIDAKILIAQIVNFAIVVTAIYYLGIRPVLKTIDDRQEKIAESLKNAEEIKIQMAEADAQRKEMLQQASQESKKTVDDARRAAKELLERETQETSRKTAEMLEKAQQSIEQERKKMLAEVREEIARLVVLTSSRVLSEELGETDRKRFLDRAAVELQNN